MFQLIYLQPVVGLVERDFAMSCSESAALPVTHFFGCLSLHVLLHDNIARQLVQYPHKPYRNRGLFFLPLGLPILVSTCCVALLF